MSKDLFNDLTSISIDDKYDKFNTETINRMRANEISAKIDELISQTQDVFWAKEVVELGAKIETYDEQVLGLIRNYNNLKTLIQVAESIIEEDRKEKARRIQNEIDERNRKFELQKIENENKAKEIDSTIDKLTNSKIKGEFWLEGCQFLFNEIDKLDSTIKDKCKKLKYIDNLKQIIPIVEQAIKIDKKILMFDASVDKDKKWCQKVLDYKIDYEYIKYITQKELFDSLVERAKTILEHIEQEKIEEKARKEKEKEEKKQQELEMRRVEEELEFEAIKREHERQKAIEEAEKQAREAELLDRFESANREFVEKFNVKVIDEKICVVGIKQDMEKIQIINGVQEIGENAFKDNLTITSVVLSDTVEDVKEGAFNGCKNLKTIEFGDGFNVVKTSAYKGCDNLTSFEVGRGNTKFESFKGDLYDKGMKNLYLYAPGKKAKKFKLPSSVSDVLFNAFLANKYLQVVDCNNANSLGAEVFKDCVNLKVVKFSAKMKWIFDKCFVNCVNLKKIVTKSRISISDKYYTFKDSKKLNKKYLENFKGFREK